MNFWIEMNLGAFLVAMILSVTIIPQILHIAFRKRLFDKADSRKAHKGTVPRLGGLAFMPSIAFSLALLIGLSTLYCVSPMQGALRAASPGLAFTICAVTLIFMVGISDDLIGVRYGIKLLVQILCGILIALGGIRILDFNGLLWLNDLPAWLSSVITVFVVVYAVNAINLIDGIDGLASGLSILATSFYGWMLYLADMQIYAMMAWAAAGTLVPFFYFNVFGNPQKRKKIFMGDTGSLTIGMTLAVLALVMTRIPSWSDLIDTICPTWHTGAVPSPRPVSRFNPVVLAFSPLIVPAFDVARVFIHRVRCRRNPFLPDRSHIHHKLLALGCQPRTAMVVILLVSIVFMVSNVIVSPYVDATWILAGDIVIWTIGNIILTNAIRKRESSSGNNLYL